MTDTYSLTLPSYILDFDFFLLPKEIILLSPAKFILLECLRKSGPLYATIQHKLAEMKTSIAVARAFTDNCLDIHNTRGLDSETASMAKYWCSDLQNKIAYDCVQMHGGWGFMWEYPIAHAFVDSRVQTIYGGSNEIMKELIARKIMS